MGNYTNEFVPQLNPDGIVGVENCICWTKIGVAFEINKQYHYHLWVHL